MFSTHWGNTRHWCLLKSPRVVGRSETEGKRVSVRPGIRTCLDPPSPAEGTAALELIDDALGWGEKRLAEYAAEAKVAAVGVKDAYGFVWDRYEELGISGLSEPRSKLPDPVRARHGGPKWRVRPVLLQSIR